MQAYIAERVEILNSPVFMLQILPQTYIVLRYSRNTPFLGHFREAVPIWAKQVLLMSGFAQLVLILAF